MVHTLSYEVRYLLLNDLLSKEIERLTNEVRELTAK